MGTQILRELDSLLLRIVGLQLLNRTLHCSILILGPENQRPVRQGNVSEIVALFQRSLCLPLALFDQEKLLLLLRLERIL